MFLVILKALCEHGNRPALSQECRELLRNEKEAPDRRLRAGMALAGLLGEAPASQDADLRGAAGFLASHFVNDLLAHPDRYNDWISAMHPARIVLIPPLEQVFRGSRSDSASFLAASVVANFAAEDPGTLTRFLLEANVRQFPVIFRAPGGPPRVARKVALRTGQERSSYAGKPRSKVRLHQPEGERGDRSRSTRLGRSSLAPAQGK